MNQISNSIIPLFIVYIVMVSLIKKQDGYSNFIIGARKGFDTVIQIAPTLIGLMVAVGVMRASGLLEFIAYGLSVLMTPFHIASELIPLILVRMFSSSAATGIVLDIYKNHGTDSVLGLQTSIIMGCSETIFYTMAVYFMSVKVTKTRYTLTGALLATLAGVVTSILIVYL
ncbi:MAG: spore maturation protein [Eubacteriales bacterium]